ncbi:MAG: cell division protein FtsW [Micavibrio sp.]|nr:cell division protein FtsW [Micavibrio sp.]
MSLFSRTNTSILGRWWWTVDRGMLAAILVLSIFGVALVATASPSVANHIGLSDYHFLIRHIIFLIPALGIMLGLSLMPLKIIRRLSAFVYLGAVAAMILVLLTGMEIKGAQRWLHIFGFSLQPSEFLKPAFIVMAAWFMSLKKARENFPGFIITGVLYCLSVTLLLLQPDFGMTFVLTSVWGAQIFLAGLPFRWVILLIVAGIGAIVMIYMSFEHVQSRVDRYFNPETGDNFQVEKSLEAFREGGVLGTGPGQGSVKLNLPDSHADFIFSVAGEEMGLVFLALIIGIYGFIIFRGLNRLISCEDMFVVLSVGGILSMFGLQALIHMGSAMQLLPAKGMTLPFMSYGGSSLLSMGFAFGIVLALTRRSVRKGISRGGLSLQAPRSQDKVGL